MPVTKPPVVSISLISDDDDDDDGIFEEEEVESESSSQGDSDYSESDDQENDEEEEINVESDEEECSDNQGCNGVKEPSLVECKTYLRKHGLMLFGTKEECRQRIKEHESIMTINLAELGLSPSVSVHVVLHDWIRHTNGKLSFLGFVKLLHGVLSRALAYKPQ